MDKVVVHKAREEEAKEASRGLFTYSRQFEMTSCWCSMVMLTAAQCQETTSEGHIVVLFTAVSCQGGKSPDCCLSGLLFFLCRLVPLTNR